MRLVDHTQLLYIIVLGCASVRVNCNCLVNHGQLYIKALFGLGGRASRWSLGNLVVQWAGWLCIGMEFRLFSCATTLLILAGYTLGSCLVVQQGSLI